MRTVILGAGASGLHLARRLIDEGQDVALIERDHDVARVAANALDCLVVTGDGGLPPILAEAGLAKARHFVAMTGSDEVNIVTCSVVAAEYPEVLRVARVRNSYFTRLEPSRRSFMGVDRFVNPDIETARAFVTLAAQDGGEGLVRLSDEDLVLRSTRLAASSPFAGSSLRESRRIQGREFLAAAIERDGKVRVPSGEDIPLPGDLLFLLGSPPDLDALLGSASDAHDQYRKIVIAGGGPVGRHLAEGFLGMAEGGELGLTRGRGHILGRKPRRGLVVVEPSMQLCKELARDIPRALTLCRPISDQEVFLEEGLEGADLFIAVTPSEELNILSAARAKDAGIERSLALCESNAYMELTGRLGLDGMVSVKSIVASSIIEYLRGGALKTLHSFYDRGLKILEYSIPEGSPLHGAAIRELRLPRGALVIYLKRRGRSSLPAGDTRLAAGDRLGIFTSMDAIQGVEKLFLGDA